MYQKRHKGSSRVGLIIGLWLIVLAAIGWWQRLAIFDAWRLFDYQPPVAITALADNTTMTAAGRHLFYVNHPDLEDKTTFNQHCSSGASGSEQTIVLGCYINHSGIYLYNVTDSRLNGIEEVTASHEMLHAAYDRLGSNEKARINQLIQATYANVTDARIRSTIDSYKQAGADVTDELHSILGTEVRNLPDALETYYKRYFTDRSKIVGYSEQYESLFTSLQNQAATIESQLTALKQNIDKLDSQLSNEEASLQAQRGSVNTAKQAQEFNARIDAYNSGVSQLNNLVAQYNSLIEKYKALSVQQQELFQAIDSHSVPTSL